MLKLRIPKRDFYDEQQEMFFSTPELVLELEHSLASLSKWESKWERPFLGPDAKTSEETLDYIRVMTLTPDVPDEFYKTLTNEVIEKINGYIGQKQSATWFNERETSKKGREVITSEIIYYWMISLNIPFECENWHLNRLFTLIKVCNEKNSPQKKKMGTRELADERRKLNEARKAQYKTQG